MSCEHVEDLLSAYLDNALTPQERVVVQEHTSTCSACRETLADYRRFDALLADLPRVSPSAALRERIFSSPEYIELTEATSITSLSEFRRSRGISQELHDTTSKYATLSTEHPFGQRLTLPQKPPTRDGKTHPHLVALPGGPQETIPRIPSAVSRQPARRSRRGSATGLRLMQIAIAACLLLTLGIGGLVGWNIWQGQQATSPSGGITPPLGVRLNGPLPAGTRYVFLQDGALWSGSTDSKTVPVARLTPSSVAVGSNWSVRPALVHHVAGNMVAYIDMKQGRIHLIRSDGQRDMAIAQALFANNVAPVSMWKTPVGMSILDSLAWSPDGSKLAFIAAPRGVAHLYTYDMNTSRSEVVSTPLQDEVLSLAWSSSVTVPTITWTTGMPGHIHAIMLQHFVQNSSHVETLATGDYAQATYHQQGKDSWLLLSQTHDILTLNLNGTLRTWTNSGAASLAAWSPKGTYIGYFQQVKGETGNYHVITMMTGNDTQIATNVVIAPGPLWSANEAALLYSNGTHVIIASSTATVKVQLPDVLSSLSWNPAMPQQAIIALQNGHAGIYTLDIIHGTLEQLQKARVAGALQWTEIP